MEGLLDEARKQMAGRKFTAALDLLREAQKLDPSAPQLRILLERLASEHQQEKQRRELERLNREVQEAIDRDDYKAASAKAAEALGKFPNETGLARLKELADTQIEIAAQKEFVRNQTAAAQQLLDSGQTQHALDAVEKALQKVPGNARLESLRALIQDRMLKERTEADKATCLRQANEAISLGRYPDAIQILESAQVRFVDSKDLDELLRFARDQQAKARRQAFVEEAMRAAQRLLAEQDFEGAVKLLEKAVGQVPSEDLDLLLRQACEQRDGFRRDLQAAIAKGKSLLEEGAIANAREFLSSRPVSYQQSVEFRDLLEEAQNTPIPVVHVDSDGTEATRMFTRSGLEDADVIQEYAPPVLTPVEPEPVAEKAPEAPEPKLPPPWKRRPLVFGGVAVALVLVGLIIWRLIPTPPKEAYLDIQSNPGAQVFVDDKPAGTVAPNGAFSAKVGPGAHTVRVEQEGYDTWSKTISVNAGQRLPVPATLTPKVVSQHPEDHRPVPTGNLVVRSDVADADVYVGEEFKGRTGHDKQLKIPLNEGLYPVQVRKLGYESVPDQTAKIIASSDTKLVFKLPKKAGAESQAPVDAVLTVHSNPGAQVRVGGQSKLVPSSGTVAFKVPPGSQSVQASMTGYKPFSGTLSLKEGEQKDLDAPMTVEPTDARSQPLPPPPPTPAATISSFKASPDTIQAGEATKLIWETQNATNVYISPDIGKVGATGEKSLKLDRTKDYTLTATGPGGAADPRSVTITVTAPPQPPPSQPPPSGPSDEDGIRQARARWNKQYEQKVGATFVQDSCPPLQPIKGDTVDWTCQEKIALLVSGTRITKTGSITYQFKKKEGKWNVEGDPVFKFSSK